jgi:dTDP-4-amino-4,6-dideoxygalactose transaminase
MNQCEEAGSRLPIPVTRPDLPPLEALMPYLEEIWRSRIVTNGGPFHAELERRLADYLGVEHVALFSNATIALVTAMQALRITGKVITTPYSFVATAHALLWNGISPVFADIDPRTLNLDPARAEEAITPDTTAIMPVHVYGVPCDVDAFQKLAERYNLKLIYDAAHAFGVQRLGHGKPHSILRYGDLSIVSFHGTKVFNTFEGGAIICPDLRTKSHIDHLKNFGFVDETTVVATGINGKLSEFNAALGLVQLQRIDRAIANRAYIDRLYRDALSCVPGIRLHDLLAGGSTNHGYFPVFIEPDFPLSRDEVYSQLREKGIMARRYFYPLITDFPMYRHLASAQSPLPVAREAASTVICLPIFPGLNPEDVHRIANFFVNARRERPSNQPVVESGGRARMVRCESSPV